MKIQTRFNNDDFVIIIDDDKIIRLKVINVTYTSGRTYYTLLKKKAASLMDKDEDLVREECDCFLNVEEIANKYKDVIFLNGTQS